mgnify:CR=1 FL=1
MSSLNIGWKVKIFGPYLGCISSITFLPLSLIQLNFKLLRESHLINKHIGCPQVIVLIRMCIYVC